MTAGQGTENTHWHKTYFQVSFCVPERKVSYSGLEQYESEYIILILEIIIHLKCVVCMQWHYQVELQQVSNPNVLPSTIGWKIDSPAHKLTWLVQAVLLYHACQDAQINKTMFW